MILVLFPSHSLSFTRRPLDLTTSFPYVLRFDSTETCPERTGRVGHALIRGFFLTPKRVAYLHRSLHPSSHTIKVVKKNRFNLLEVQHDAYSTHDQFVEWDVAR